MKASHEAGIKTIVTRKITDLVQSDKEVTITFENGTVVTADFVVGADGIHSKTRKLVFPEVEKPIVCCTGHIGVFDLTVFPRDFDLNTGLYSDPLNSRMIFTSRCSDSEGDMQVFEFASETQGQVDGDDEWRPYTDLPAESAKLAKVVESWGAAPNLVECVKHTVRITPVNIYDLPDLSTFYRGRVVLVGDAAHGTVPTYGQGVNQAIEDAGVLADLLGHFQDTEYKKAFALYDSIRIPRTRLCAASARTTMQRMKANSKLDMKIGRFMMKTAFRIMRTFGMDDEVFFHDFRQDVIKAVPDI
ncbi:hypothetical protein HDU99_003155, partial [Rhizoclosmatium hyalinum]